MAVNITGKPLIGVGGMGAPVRYSSGSNTRLMKVSWAIPNWLTDDNNKERATGFKITWSFDFSTKTAAKDPKKVVASGNTSLTESAVNLNNLVIGNKTYSRSSFYPQTKVKLNSVTASVVPTNTKGDGAVVAKQTRKFLKPQKPTISTPTFNPSNGTVSATITTNAGLSYRERYDTRYYVSVYDSRTKKTTRTTDTSSTSTSITASRDVSDYRSLAYGDYVKINIVAWARGYAGNSDKAKRTYYVSYPAATTIKNVDISSNDSTGKVTAHVKTNNKTEHPVDKVVLEYLANVDYSTQAAIPGDASWTSSDIVDDAQCTALAMPVADLMPERGKYTWLRIKSFHCADQLYRYSNYMSVDQLFTPAATAADDEIKIIDAHAGAGGDSIIVVLGWNADGEDDSTGTELSWSRDEDSWKSTKEPDTYSFTWSDGELVDGNTTYNDSASIAIKDLAEGQKYYIKARRYLEGDITTYSPYSNTATSVTSEQPDAVVAFSDGYVADGDPLQVYWTFSGNGLQQRWQIVSTDEVYSYVQVVGATGSPAGQGFYERSGNNYVLSADTTVNSGKTYYTQATYGSVIAEGEGSLGATQISAERLETFATNGVVSFTVQVSTGSGFISSEKHSVAIISKPVVSATIASTLTAQPMSFTVTCTTISDLIIIVTSQGAASQLPEGLAMQTSGDTIYSDVVTPTWTVSGGAFTTTVELPSGLDFWDLCGYEISIVAVDQTTSLKSEEAVYSFNVGWATKAKYPSVTITPVDTIDANGVHHLAADIALSAPTSSNSSDVYDIYRMDCGKAYLIGQSFPRSITVRDEYAPFSDGDELYYRIALRTADGSVSFKDIGYVLESKAMRFDWRDGVLELPYGLTITDSYSKDVEFRSHMDGNIDGYWRQNVERKSALGTSVIKLIQPTEIEMARKLARYTGAVFVRLPNGTAYEADVQVSDMSVKNEAVTAIAIDATEIGLTDEFSLPTPYTL